MKLSTGRKTLRLTASQVEVLPPASPVTITGKVTVSAQHLRSLLENPHAWEDVKLSELPNLIRLFSQIETDLLVLRKRHFGSQR